MKNFLNGPFDFNGDGTLDPFELGTEFMIFEDCTKDEGETGWFDDEKDDWDNDETDTDWDE